MSFSGVDRTRMPCWRGVAEVVVVAEDEVEVVVAGVAGLVVVAGLVAVAVAVVVVAGLVVVAGEDETGLVVGWDWAVWEDVAG